MRTLNYYLGMPWAIRRTEYDDDGSYVSLTIEELPGFLVASKDDEGLQKEFWSALSVFLSSYLDRDEEPPIPSRRITSHTLPGLTYLNEASEDDRTIRRRAESASMGSSWTDDDVRLAAVDS